MNIDKRFSRIVKDARFKRIPKKEKKVKIDSRFKSMFKDRKFKTKYYVDKRGRPIMKSSKEDLKRFYELEEDGPNDEAQEIEKAEDGVENEHNNDIVEPTEGHKEERVDVLQGSSHKDDNIENDDDDDEDDEEDDDDEEVDFSDIRGVGLPSSDEEDAEESGEEQVIEHQWGELDQDAPRKEDAVTSRLAACNLDWDRVTADDLFVLFSSLGGKVHSVKIFLSEFGKQRLAEEDLNGPSELRNEDEAESGDGESGDEDDPNNAEGSRFHLEKLRKYQLNRLKYYYAVVDCDSKDTANKIYDQYDGIEYELSATRLDLRFVPDDMEFTDEPKSIVTKAPLLENFKPTAFCNTALQQSTVRSTWDEPDQKRIAVTMRKFNKDDILDMDFKAYLASSSDEDETEVTDNMVANGKESDDKGNDENEDEAVEKYRALLNEIEAKEHKEDDDQHMEISWEPGLSETAEKIVKNKIEKEEEKSMTPWEKYKKDRKRKKKERKLDDKSEKASDDSDENDPDEDISDDESPSFNDPFFSQDLSQGNTNENGKSKKRKRKTQKKGDVAEDENDVKNKKELELLLMDDKEEKQHFNLKSIMKNEKQKKKKKRDKHGNPAEKVEDTFEIDVQDSRFNALFTSHEYAPDPSDPQFKKTKAMEKILQEKQRRRKEISSQPSSDKLDKDNEQVRTIDPSLSALIKTVKSRTEQFQSRKKSKLR